MTHTQPAEINFFSFFGNEANIIVEYEAKRSHSPANYSESERTLYEQFMQIRIGTD